MQLFVSYCMFLLVFARVQAFCPAGQDGEDGEGMPDELDVSDALTYDEDDPDLPEGLKDAYEAYGGKVEAKVVDNDDDILANSKSMSEIVDATMKEEFTYLFMARESKKATAMEILQYVLDHTKIVPSYLQPVFMKITKTESEPELKKKMYNDDKALKVISSLLHHFQDYPNEGRPEGELEEQKQKDKDEEKRVEEDQKSESKEEESGEDKKDEL